MNTTALEGRIPRKPRARHHQPARGAIVAKRVAGASWAGARLAAWGAVAAACLVLAALGIGPRFGAYRTLTVLSGSMAPHIPVAALVVDTPERPDQLRVGQVITYQIPVGDHRVESHRVVQIVRGGDQPIFVTQGDANAARDPWTAQVTSPTVWRVRWVIPYAGRALLALRAPVVHRVLVWAVPALLAILCLIDIWGRPSWAALQLVGKVALLLGLAAVAVAAPLAPPAWAAFRSSPSPPALGVSSATLAPPTSLSASCGVLKVNLTWTASSSARADGYKVFRSTTNGGPYGSALATVTGVATTSYSDSSGLALGTFYYVLETYKGTTWTSANSNQASVTVLLACL